MPRTCDTAAATIVATVAVAIAVVAGRRRCALVASGGKFLMCGSYDAVCNMPSVVVDVVGGLGSDGGGGGCSY